MYKKNDRINSALGYFSTICQWTLMNIYIYIYINRTLYIGKI